MADVLAVITGLADAIRTSTRQRAYALDRDLIETPCFVVRLPEAEYHADFGGGVRLTFAVRYLVGRNEEVVAQERMAAAMSTDGALGLLFAAELDGTLGGTADSTAVTAATKNGVYSYGETDYLGVEFTVDVLI